MNRDMDTDRTNTTHERFHAHIIVQRKESNPNGFYIHKDITRTLYGRTTERGTVKLLLKSDKNVLVYDEKGQVIAKNYIGGIIDA